MISPPINAPGRLPNPPITAAAKALMPMKPICGLTSEIGAVKVPATAVTKALMAQINEYIRFTGIPI